MKLSISELSNILGAVPVNIPDPSLMIFAISSSSRTIEPGAAFVAVSGAASDGHDYADDAIKRGASLLVISRVEAAAGAAALLVPDTRKALSRLASLFAGDPSHQMTCVGITGTNGKTTINWMVHHIFRLLGLPSIRVGTLGTCAEGVIDRDEGLTTPNPISVHRDLAYALEHGVRHAVFEASSHALDQSRVDDVEFDVAVFTNLTRDHLDYHGDMETYFRAKERLFDLVASNLKNAKGAVINVDCPEGERLASKEGLNIISYGFSDAATLRIGNLVSTSQKMGFTLSASGKDYALETQFIGRHNAFNIAAALGSLLALGYSLDETVPLVAKVPQVPGRLQYIRGNDFDVFVDYAHTPDALENALSALKEVCRGKLWVLVGCGGDRDKGKRPQMAEIAQRMADGIVFTSDNPRTEDPDQILNDMISTGVKPDFLDADRRKAIQWIISHALKDDVVLVAGKGHEDYQVLGTTKIHLSDVEEVEKSLLRDKQK